MAERRFTTGELRVEEDTGGKTMVGHASVFERWTTLYEGRYWRWREKINAGAFTRAIEKKQDVRALFNHDPNFVLGRTTSGTLEIQQDKTGLLTRTKLPRTQTVRDLVETPIDRGDITGMSFAFDLPKDGKLTHTKNDDGSEVIETPYERSTLRYEGEMLCEDREILSCDLYDVSAVTYPAYEQTDVALRSVPDLRALIAEKDRPHRRPAPRREALRQWLEGSAIVATLAHANQLGHAGRKEVP